MKTTETNKVKNAQVENVVNPFIKLMEDQIAISKAIKDGKPLSSVKGVRFVKPI